MLDLLVDLVYPRRCLGCGARGWPFCPRCDAAVARLSPPGCRRCGRPLEAAISSCRDCPPPPLVSARAAFLYEGPVRRAVFTLKFGGARAAADGLAPAVLEALRRDPVPGLSPDPVLTWVPLGPRRRRERGYDQAEALARSLARLTDWPLRPLLRRTVETPPQARRSAGQRERALRGAFTGIGAAPPRVVLVDDVLTTGATAAACAAALRRAGAGEVGLVTVARALGGGIPAR